MLKHRRLTIIAFVCILMLSACQELSKIPLREYWDDQNIKSEVKTRLAADNALEGTRIEVESDGRVVYLTGMVVSEKQKTRAAEIAFKVPGVRGVGNQLEIKKMP